MAQKILLVEDDPINVKFIEVVLTRMGGYEVVVSEDVDEILALAKGGTLAGIIMDISLARSSYQGKKVDGIFITNLLKADAETKTIPVLLATAHGAVDQALSGHLAEDGKGHASPAALVDDLFRFLSGAA